MGLLFKNNAYSVLAVSLSEVGTSITVETGDGSLFPAAGGGDYFYATLFLEDGTNEIVKCTNRSGDTLTVTRAQDGTAARAWLSTTTRIECRVNAATLEDIRDTADLASTNASSAVSTAGAASSAASAAQADADAANEIIGNLELGWVNTAETIVSSTGSTVVVSGDKTATYVAGRPIRVNASGAQTGLVQSSSYGAPNTTITITGFTVSSPTQVEVGVMPAASMIPAGALANGMTCTTQSPGDNSGKLASTEYADASADAAVSGIKRLEKRQTVLAGSVDSSGHANFISAGSGFSVNVAATSKPIVLAAANGYNSAGNLDRVGVVSADTSIGSLTPSSTCYLYADIAADGSVTFGHTTLAPVYQWGGTYSTTSGQFTFNIQEMIGKVGNGSSAVQTYRLFIGEATTNGSGVTAVVNYAIQGRYQSAAAAIAINTKYSYSANIGVTPRVFDVYMVNTSTDLGYAVGDIVKVAASDTDSLASRAVTPWVSGRNTVNVSTGNGTVSGNHANGGAGGAMTYSKWNHYVVADRGW